MKKKNKKVNNTLYALVYELVFIPLLAYVSFFIYVKFTMFSFMDNNVILSMILLSVLVIINLYLIYLIAYALNHIYKFDLEYQIVVGIIIIFIAVWFKVYYHVAEVNMCELGTSSSCLIAIDNNDIITTVLVFLVAYNLVYIPMHIITKRKGKKIKFSLEKEKK